jgi:hypothetical protein
VLTDGTRHRWPLERPPLPLETSLPGVFAVGDVRHRSTKRVASAVGAGAGAIQLVHDYFDATSSARAGPMTGNRRSPSAARQKAHRSQAPCRPLSYGSVT